MHRMHVAFSRCNAGHLQVRHSPTPVLSGAGYFHLCIAVSHDFFSKLNIPTKRKKSIGNNLEGIMFADDRISMQIINKFL